MFNFLRTSVCCLLLAGVLAGCASIVSKSSYPISINTTPDNVQVKITDEYNTVVYEGLTPLTMPLKADAGYFRPAYYQVTLSQPGYKPQTFHIEARIDGWYFANIAFGGFIGMLVVDPLTGAMWKLPAQYYNFTLSPDDEASTKQMRILTIDEVPENLQDKLEPLEKESKQ